jgi:Fe-S-cluster containining protein
MSSGPPIPDDPRWPDDVRERWKTAGAVAQANVDAINDAMGDKADELTRRLRKLVVSNQSVRSKVRALYQLVDEHSSYTKGHTACKKGCGHCCHIAAPISKVEAEMIGEATGIEPKPIKPGVLIGDQSGNILGFDWGYHNPCAFLKDGSCSIYEHRPLTCRAHFNLDQDELLCRIQSTEVGHMVPYMDMSRYRFTYALIVGAKLADIREFFPRENRK